MLYIRPSEVLRRKQYLAISILVAVWDAVTTKTVVNCFQKYKISIESQKATVAEDDNPFIDLVKKIKNLGSIQLDFV